MQTACRVCCLTDQQWVEEAQRDTVLLHYYLVQQRRHGREDGGAHARAADRIELALNAEAELAVSSLQASGASLGITLGPTRFLPIGESAYALRHVALACVYERAQVLRDEEYLATRRVAVLRLDGSERGGSAARRDAVVVRGGLHAAHNAHFEWYGGVRAGGELR